MLVHVPNTQHVQELYLAYTYGQLTTNFKPNGRSSPTGNACIGAVTPSPSRRQNDAHSLRNSKYNSRAWNSCTGPERKSGPGKVFCDRPVLVPTHVRVPGHTVELGERIEDDLLRLEEYRRKEYRRLIRAAASGP